MDGGVGRDPQYESFADEFAEHAERGFYNVYLDRPACLALLGDVAGKRVLLAFRLRPRPRGPGDSF